MIYCFDIDGVICTNTNGTYEQAVAHPKMVQHINELYDAGHRVVIFTARGSTTGIEWKPLTEKQLNLWGVKYHEFHTGKPHADVYVDDKAANWEELRQRFVLETESVPKSREQSIFQKSSYLDVTYAASRAPLTQYPDLLASWLLRSIFQKPGRLLDLGVGRGDHLAAFSRLGFEVAGIDASPTLASLSSQYEIRVADIESDPLPFPPKSFDCVFSKSVIEHMHHPDRLMSKAFDALRPGGIAVIMTPSWAHTYWGPFYIDHTHVTPFTAPSLKDALVMSGFQSPQVSHFYQLPFLWRYPLLKPMVRLLAAFPIPYRPYESAPWPEGFNKLIRFAKEVMLLAVARKD